MDRAHLGSCLCGQVHFEVIGHFEGFYLCHCKHCQKDTGSAHAANLVSSNAKLCWVKGAEKVKTYNLPSTRHVKSFCTECSSALPSIQFEGKLLVVPAGSMDTQIDIPVTAHIFDASKASWEKNLDSVKKFARFPS